jgi:hypothetical protein
MAMNTTSPTSKLASSLFQYTQFALLSVPPHVLGCVLAPLSFMLLSLNLYRISHNMCTSWCINGQDHPYLADNDRLIFFLSCLLVAIEQGSEDKLAKVKKFWQSLSVGQRSEILSTSLDDIWAKLPDVTDDGECLYSLHQAGTSFLSRAQQKALSTGATCVHACLHQFAGVLVSCHMACAAD